MVKSPVMACSQELVKRKPHRVSIRLTERQYEKVAWLSGEYNSTMAGIAEYAVARLLTAEGLGEKLKPPKDGRRK